MNKFDTHMKDYLKFCKTQKCLDAKTIRAYTIDLSQFVILMLIFDIFKKCLDTAPLIPLKFIHMLQWQNKIIY